MANYDVMPPARRQLIGRLQRLVRKELREILRDRRTIITLVVMPILIYPLLAVVFQRFLLTSIATHSDVHFDIGVDSDFAGQQLERELIRGEQELSKRNRNVETSKSHATDQSAPDAAPTP